MASGATVSSHSGDTVGLSFPSLCWYSAGGFIVWGYMKLLALVIHAMS